MRYQLKPNLWKNEKGELCGEWQLFLLCRVDDDPKEIMQAAQDSIEIIEKLKEIGIKPE